MYSDWQGEAKRHIAAIDLEFATDTPWQERQKRLRSAAYQFHGGTSWGQKVWAKHCRQYLERHGKPPRTTPKNEPTFAPDIVFPFRSERVE